MVAGAEHMNDDGRRGVRAVVRQHRFTVLLGALALLIIGAPLVRALGPGTHPRLAEFVIPLLFTVVILASVFATGRSRTTEIIALSLAVPAVILQALQVWLATDGLAIAGHLVGILFLGYAIVLVLKYLFVTRRVSSDLICASLCVYLLIGLLCALAYSLIHFLDPKSFAFSFADESEVQLIRFGGEQTIVAIYYSFVTMSTLGYGDIVPISSPARTCASMQAIVGQLYLAVLVARLVGLQVSQSAQTNVDAPDVR